MTSATNIIKSRIYAPELPWNVRDPERLGPAIINYTRDHESYFRRWTDTWFENFQFVFGNHAIKWSKRYGVAVDYDFLRRNEGFGMRAQTNVARVITEALSSLIYSNLPSWAANAMDQSAIKGKRFAKIVEKILDCYMHRLNMDKEFATAALIYVLFGQFACRVDWNMQGGKLLEVPQFKKTTRPVFSTYMAPNAMTGGLIEIPTQAMDGTGKPMMEDIWEAVVDQTGRQVVNKFFAGDLRVDMLTPFQYRRPIGSPGMHKSRWIQEFKLMDYDQFLDEYEDLPGKTKLFDRVRPVNHDPLIYSFAVRHFMRMQFTTPPSLDDGMRRSESVFKSQLFKYKVFVVEHWDQPHPKKWKDGRRVVTANGVCTHMLGPSYTTNKLDGWHPYIEGQWMSIAPSSIAAGPMNDVIKKNRELDVMDSLKSTAIRRNMGSMLLIKSGMGLNPQMISGEPGQSHEVSDPYGARWLHDEMPIPTVLPALREAEKADVYEVAGAGDALRGQPSTGASSGYQEKQREEREQKRLTPAKKNFRQAVAGIGEKMVACLKANVVELDENVIGYLKRAAAGEFTVADAMAFLFGKIDYGVEVAVEEESMEMKSKATRQATIQELAQGPLGQRLSQDAKVLDKYLEEFDCETLRDASAAHRDRAQRENEVFLDMATLGGAAQGVSKPIVLFEDDDNIHQAEHAEFFVQNAEQMLANEAMLVEFLVHCERHRLQSSEKAATLPPGTSLQTPQMVQTAMGTQQPPQPQQIFQNTQVMKQQAQAAQAQGNPQGGKQAPQAPKLGKPAGAPKQAGRPTNPQAPSASTPSAPSPAASGGKA
jgi:hypothetical protein